MKVSKAIEGILLNMVNGAQVPELFTRMHINDFKDLLSWVREIEGAYDPRDIILEVRTAPQWIIEAVEGRRIDAIKEVRASLSAHLDTGGTKPVSLITSKNFVEAFINCVKR